MDLTYKTVSKMAERWGFDWCDEYGEPGYYLPHDAQPHAGIIIGNFWCQCGQLRERFVDGQWQSVDEVGDGEQTRNVLHDVFHHYPRLAAALEEQGWQLEWEDEWIINYDGGGKCYRTKGDSYSWQSSILWIDGNFLTPDDGIDAWIAEVVDDPHRCLSSAVWTSGDLERAGFVQWEPDDPHFYENGWHPGQDDDPETIANAIRAHDQDVEIVFYLNDVGQFDMRFSAWVRAKEDDQ